MAEKFYSVVAELADGTTKQMPVRGESSSDVFRKVREMPGVRRVGRVTEVASKSVENPSRGHVSAGGHTPELKSIAHDAKRWVAHVISGPRMVVYAPPRGGEQPFKHLKAPPERPAPTAPSPKSGVVRARAALNAQSSPSITATVIPIPEAGEPEHRIVKSRRRDGLPYFLQRGRWQDRLGKRVFNVEWEKGFEGRAQAEQHLSWVERTEKDLAELQQSA